MFKGEGINCVRVRQRELKWREREIFDCVKVKKERVYIKKENPSVY
jgi:hypothetical protein